jgi:hypothetical protein
MAFDRFLIAPINSGLQKNLRPWLIPDDAFEYLQNAYVFRGRVKKRFGSTFMGTSQYMSRLRINIGTVTSHVIPGGIDQLAIGQVFSVGTDIFTIYALGAAQPTLSTNPAASATINSTSNPNTVTFTGESGAAIVYYYPALPVMGITQYESGSINDHPSYAFDTQFAYVFTTNVGWNRSGTGTSPEWNGDDLDFFWTCNWKGITDNVVAMFVTNFQVTNYNGVGTATDDPIWVTQDGSTWTKFIPYFLPAGGAMATGAFVETCRIIVAFKDRLVLLNTVENNGGATLGTNSWYPQRCRYSFNGSPFARNAWYEPNQFDNSGGVVNFDNLAAGAGFIDAATDEQIISSEFIKDRLIVYFERSTWELVYTGNEVLPFIWQKINTELGSQSTFSTVPFDKAILTIGQTGVHACNGANVERIDSKIPDEIFEFETDNSATLRTFGIRDYYSELVYWTFQSDIDQPTQNFPNQILVYNYENDSWGIFDDCFTAFGYFEQQANITWASSYPLTWEQANMTWDSGVLSGNQRQIIAGTPEGFMLIIDDDISRNAPSMQISEIGPLFMPQIAPFGRFVSPSGILTLVIINHNLSQVPIGISDEQDYILLENIVADATTMALLNGTIWPVYNVIDSDTIQINTFGLVTAGTYTGGGTAARVSNIQIESKQWNPYVDNDRSFYLQRIDFGVQRTTYGQITIDYYPSASEASMIQGGQASGAIMGNNILETSPYDPVLYPLEQFQQRLWHPVYFQSVGESIQIVMYLSAAQMTNPAIALEDFELEGLVLFTQPTSARLE